MNMNKSKTAEATEHIFRVRAIINQIRPGQLMRYCVNSIELYEFTHEKKRERKKTRRQRKKNINR